jgi:hypothetical protein
MSKIGHDSRGLAFKLIALMHLEVTIFSVPLAHATTKAKTPMEVLIAIQMFI